MQGTRTTKPPHLLEPGEYCLYEGEWYGQTPNDLLSALASTRSWNTKMGPSLSPRGGLGGPEGFGPGTGDDDASALFQFL